jgi:diacylglycerol kinase (ATP)
MRRVRSRKVVNDLRVSRPPTGWLETLYTCALKTLILLNGIARKKKKFFSEILPALQKKFEITVMETSYAGHASQLAAEALNQNYDCILAAGGDGTLHQVINGILSVSTTQTIPSLGLIPLGSGNDFAATCGLSFNVSSTVKLLAANQPKPTDVGKIVCCDEQGNEIVKYFINACSIGMGPATVQRMEKSPKWLNPDLLYLISILHTFFTYHPAALNIKTTSWEWGGKVRVFAVANGKSFGNKIFIAPDAMQDDGFFNSFLAGEVPLLKFLWLLQSLKQKKKVNDQLIAYSKMKEVVISSQGKTLMEAEGELVGYLPARIEMMPSRILFFR